MKKNNLILEACVETLEEAINAEQNGANRLELCSRLDLDGLTPKIALTKTVLDHVNIPLKVMIRPREGDFIYTDEEFNQLKKEIEQFKTLPVQGVVFGMLDADHRLNLDQISDLAKLAYPLEVTIHKAIDLCPDPVGEIRKLKTIPQVTSVLTSGKAETATEGEGTIREMIENAGHIKVIAAGRITSSNLEEVRDLIRASEYHGRRIV